jgi:hypothetical protein
MTLMVIAITTVMLLIVTAIAAVIVVVPGVFRNAVARVTEAVVACPCCYLRSA